MMGTDSLARAVVIRGAASAAARVRRLASGAAFPAA
ncbi:hypothetical protein dqs_2703 [Azoarcus olearius]|nr:hypothetical protein dqs_2703 [Azoarcus olearius]